MPDGKFRPDDNRRMRTKKKSFEGHILSGRRFSSDSYHNNKTLHLWREIGKDQSSDLDKM